MVKLPYWSNIIKSSALTLKIKPLSPIIAHTRVNSQWQCNWTVASVEEGSGVARANLKTPPHTHTPQTHLAARGSAITTGLLMPFETLSTRAYECHKTY